MDASGADELRGIAMTYQTYEERQGRGPLPEIATIGHLSPRFRRKLILAFENHDYVVRRVKTSGDRMPYRDRAVNWENKKFLIKKWRGFHIDVLDFLLSEIGDIDVETALVDIANMLNEMPADGHPASVVNFCDYFLSDPDPAGEEIRAAIAEVFDKHFTAYSVVPTQDVEGKPIRQIWPAIGGMSADVMGEAINRINESSAVGAQTYIRKGAECLNAGDYVGGVRQGWLAVESAAQQITGKPNQALDNALKEILRDGLIPNSAIREIFANAMFRFNKYANKFPGLRHASSTELPPDMSPADARFFYALCVNAVDYLAPYLPDNPNGEGEDTANNDNS